MPNGDTSNIPLQFQAQKLSDLICRQLDDALEDGTMSITEMAGLLGMASSLSDYASGRVKGLMAHSMMRTLAEKKTPAPIARSENVTHFDIKNNLIDIVKNNPDALERTNAIADHQRETIQKKLQTDNLLMLKKADVQRVAKDEPEEIKKLRGEGGG
jgi:hypothetical protein